MSKLNHFESDMLEEIAKYNNASHPWLHEQIEKIEVKKRELTGVGLYVNFKESRIDGIDIHQEATLSSNQVLITRKLKNIQSHFKIIHTI